MTFLQTSPGEQRDETPAPIVRWMMSALTDRSFPAHLHSSLLLRDAGQGICNKDKMHFLFRRKNPVHKSVLGCELIQLRPACTQPVCVHVACMRTRGLKRSQCDLFSTLFQFTPLFIQVYQEHLTVLTQHVIVCKRPRVWNMHEALLCGDRTEGPEIPELLTGAPGGGAHLKSVRKGLTFGVNAYKKRKKTQTDWWKNQTLDVPVHNLWYWGGWKRRCGLWPRPRAFPSPRPTGRCGKTSCWPGLQMSPSC